MDEFGGIPVEDPKADEFGGVAVEEPAVQPIVPVFSRQPTREALARKQMQERPPFAPLVPLGPDIKGVTLPGKIGAAVYNEGKRFVEGAESPAGIAMLPLGAGGRVASAALGAGFGIPAIVQGAKRVYAGSALGDTQEAIEGGIQTLAGGAITGGAAAGLRKPVTIPKVIRDTARGTIPPEAIVPAVREMGGEVIPGKPGDTHADIIKENDLKAVDIDQRGFSDPAGKVFIDREAAAKGTQAPTDFEEGRLHSTDLTKAQEEQPSAQPDPTKTVEPKPTVTTPVTEEVAPPPSDALPTQSAPSSEAAASLIPTEQTGKRVAYASSSTRRFHTETELNGPDILSWMQENMKMLSARAARLKWGREKFRTNQSLYDDAPTLQKPHHNIIYDPRGESPDRVAQAAYESGQIKEPSVNALWSAIDAASKKRKNIFETGRREAKFIKEEAKQHTDWLKATKEGEKRISAEELKQGDFLQVEGQHVEVTAVDPDGNVTLKDGTKFGTQVIGEGQNIYVERFDPTPEEEVDFGPPPTTTPKLGAMEKGTGDLLKGVEEGFSLTGERGTDAERLAAEKSKAEKSASEAKAIADKQQGIFGMGGATPSEFSPGGTPTSIKNSAVDSERAKRGLPPAIQPLRRSFGYVWDRAMAMIDHDPATVDTLLDSLRDRPRALTDTEDALLLHRQVDLQNEYAKATRDLAQAHDDGRSEAVATERNRVANLSDQLLDLYNIGKQVGTETGRGLNARKMMANEDFTTAKMELDMRAAKNGAPLSNSERAEIQSLHDKIAATQKAYDDYVAATAGRISEAEAKRVIAETLARTAPTFDRRVLNAAEGIVKKMEEAAKPAADRLRARLSRLSAGVDPTIVSDAAIVGSAKIARLGLDAAKFTDEMVRDFGERIRPLINEIWAEANKILDAATANVPDNVKRAVKKAEVPDIKKATVSAVTDKMKKGQKDKITWEVQKLARALVKSGITGREELIDAVHEVLQEAIPGISRRETMDAISGYGDYKQLSKDAITIQLRGMKGEMQQLAKLEDMAKGEPPLKSGVERRTPTEAERRLIKLVNDAKFKFQIPVSNPELQLKSALDTLKTTLKNRITDYRDRIARGDYAVPPRRTLELDRQASQLKAQAERVKKQFQRGVALERLKNRTKIERGADWVTKWRRGFILSGPVTLAKLTSAAVQRALFTPLEELAGGAIGRAFPGVASRAQREGGFNVKAEAKAITHGIIRGMDDSWKTLKTGQSDLDVLYGKEALMAPTAIDFFGHVHGALKAPVKRAEFARAFEKRTAAAISGGVDPTDPMVQSGLVVAAYKDANRAIFQQDNRVITAYKLALHVLEKKDKATGRVPLAGKAVATTARVLLPIVKIPVNIVAETMQYATGTVTGSARLARAYAKGIENLKPDEADLIMRSLKKGSLGAAVMTLGFLNPEVVGGYYQPGQKRKTGDVKAGNIRLYGLEVPSYLLHSPLLETLQMGATVRRVAESKISKKDPRPQGVGSGLMAAARGQAEAVPFVRETSLVSHALDPRQSTTFWGDLARSLFVPQMVQSVATYNDKTPSGEPIKRHPRTVLENIKTGIPGLRETVPKSTR